MKMNKEQFLKTEFGGELESTITAWDDALSRNREDQKGEEMSEKSDVKVPEEIRKGWEEARLCANLIREGKAKIMIATRKDGTTYRYTKPK